MENINNDELDLVTFSDEEGNEFQMEVWDYFEHEGQEYAILFDLESEQDEDAETEVYIMKVTVEGEDEILPARRRGQDGRAHRDRGEDAGRGLLRRGLRQLRSGGLRRQKIRPTADKGTRPFAAI